jgi:hypothetical protein
MFRCIEEKLLSFYTHIQSSGLRKEHIHQTNFFQMTIVIIPIHSWRLRMCPEPAGIRCAPSARARTISQLLLQFRILLLKSLNLSLVKRP